MSASNDNDAARVINVSHLETLANKWEQAGRRWRVQHQKLIKANESDSLSHNAWMRAAAHADHVRDLRTILAWNTEPVEDQESSDGTNTDRSPFDPTGLIAAATATLRAYRDQPYGQDLAPDDDPAPYDDKILESAARELWRTMGGDEGYSPSWSEVLSQAQRRKRTSDEVDGELKKYGISYPLGARGVHELRVQATRYAATLAGIRSAMNGIRFLQTDKEED